MKPRILLSRAIALAIAAAALTSAGIAAHAASPSAPASRPQAPRIRAACGPAKPGHARCLTLYKPQTAVNQAIAAGARGPAAQPAGWGAPVIASAYKLPVATNPNQTVAIVDAFSTPHLAADLAFYRKHYGLPPCTTASGCLKIVNQAGKTTPLPAADPQGWGVEETLDVSMVSAACPHCKILLIEAKDNSFVSLAAAENLAAKLGAQVISNSYGGSESGFDQQFDSAYDHPGHVIVVSSGDLGYGAANSPANLTSVTAVGGTQLAKASNARGWKESVWHSNAGGAGSGCSVYVAKPAWQHDKQCPGRTVADVSALAWNIALYDTSLGSLGGPWVTIGGTSAAAPIIAGVYALAGNAAQVTPGYSYAHSSQFFDITSGSNALFNTPAKVCGSTYMCVAKPGYDAPTGLGTPDGIGGF